jgi:K+-transporting ATPase KdpF subunit
MHPTSFPASNQSVHLMEFDLYLGGVMALALGLYLLYALVHPEKF